MTIAVQQNTAYNLQTFVGDSGTVTFTISGLDEERLDEYTAYLEIHGDADVVKTSTINEDLQAVFSIEVDDTDALGTGKFEYGFKICIDDTENTIVPNLKCGNKAWFIVNPKVVEGTEDE